MTIQLLKPVSKFSQRVLARLVHGLDVGDSRKLDNAPGTFMAVHVEALLLTTSGVLYSIAHYYEQNGDLCPDPDVVFVRRADGSFCAISLQNTLIFSQPVRGLDSGVLEVSAREQANITSFSNMFLRNIAAQQGIGGGR